MMIHDYTKERDDGFGALEDKHNVNMCSKYCSLRIVKFNHDVSVGILRKVAMHRPSCCK